MVEIRARLLKFVKLPVGWDIPECPISEAQVVAFSGIPQDRFKKSFDDAGKVQTHLSEKLATYLKEEVVRKYGLNAGLLSVQARVLRTGDSVAQVRIMRGEVLCELPEGY